MDKATERRTPEVVAAELEAAANELAILETELPKLQARRLVLMGGWGGGGLIGKLKDELMDVRSPVVEVNGGRWVVLGVTAAQARVRRYGAGASGRQVQIRSGTTYPCTLDVCRAAWKAAGRPVVWEE